MPRSADVARSIESLRRVREVIGVMRTLAGAQIRLVGGRLERVRRYREVVNDLMARFVRPGAGAVDGATVVVVLGSDRGLCGAFHERVAELAVERLAGHAAPRLVVVGARTAEALHRRGVRADEVLAAAGSVDETGELLRALARHLEEEIDAGRAGAVELVGAAADRIGRYRAEARPLVPPPAPPEPRPMPFHYATAEAIAVATGGQYLFIALTAAILETLAAENGARLAAMEEATRNVDDELERRGRAMHRLRQREITEEVLEVAAGALAAGQTGDGP